MQLRGEDLIRSEEWEQIAAFVAGADRTPVTLVLAGEVGAGKSMLWRAAVALATQEGQRVLGSEPTAAERDFPFAGLIDLLGDALDDVPDIPEPRRVALEIAMLRRPPAPAPPTAHAVGLGVLDVLRGLSGSGQILLAIDDVQWLDEASREALTFAVRRAGDVPVRLLVSARTHASADLQALAAPPASERWRDLATASTHRTLELEPLDLRQLRRLLPFPLDAAALRGVHDQSRGNPFWAGELATALDSSDGSVPTLARTLTDRLTSSLTSGATEAVAAVGAAGRLSIAAAIQVLDHLEDPLARIDEAVLAGMVTEVDRRLTAAHPLIGAAAIESLPPERRRHLHQRLAETATSAEQHAYFAALANGDHPDEAIAAALDAAAEAAHRRAGNAEAAQFALRALHLTPDDQHDLRTVRTIRTAELTYLSGDFAAAHARAVEVDLNRLTPAALERFLPLRLDLTDVIEGEAAATAIVADLCGRLGTNHRRRAAILASAADFSYGLPERRRSSAAQAIEDAARAGRSADPSMHRALLNLTIAQITVGGGFDHELLERAERLEQAMAVDRLHDSADLVRGLWSRRVEELDVSRQALMRSIRLARETGDEFAQITSLTHLALNAELAGYFGEARELLNQAATASAWQEWPALAPWHTEPRCYLMIADGDLDGALRLSEEAMPDADGAPSATRFIGNVVRGTVSGWRGDPAGAVRWLESAAGHADACEFADPGVRRGLDSLLAEAQVALGRTEPAGRVAAWLDEVGRRLQRPTLTGNAARIRALIAAHEGDLDRSAEWARAAVADHRRSPLRLELARSLWTLGGIERRRQARKRAREALVAARDLSRTLGHRPILELIEADLERVGSVRSANELTTSERRVAELIAGGASNADAANALVVSVRTVETHLAAIYRKLAVHNRAELTQALADRND